MAAFWDFTKSPYLSGKLGNCKYISLEMRNMIQLNILPLLAAFYKFLT